jgi:hypothetical protein
MDYNFQKFESRNAKQEERITLTKASNSIGFPQKFYQNNNIAEFNYVVLFWDSNNKAIAIHLTNNEEEKNKFKIIVSKDGYGGGIGVRSFLRFYGIDSKIYHGRYDWEKTNIPDIGEVFIIKLKEAKDSKVIKSDAG